MRRPRVFVCQVCSSEFISIKKDPRSCSPVCKGVLQRGERKPREVEVSAMTYCGLTRYVIYALPNGFFVCWDSETNSAASRPLSFADAWARAIWLERHYGTRLAA